MFYSYRITNSVFIFYKVQVFSCILLQIGNWVHFYRAINFHLPLGKLLLNAIVVEKHIISLATFVGDNNDMIIELISSLIH